MPKTKCVNGHPYVEGSFRTTPTGRRYCIECYGPNPAHTSEYRDERWRAYRAEALVAYGGTCVCCGEDWYDFLHIDHIEHGTGNAQRAGGLYGNRLLWWLRKHGYPAGYQVLCANCNHAKGMRRDCPSHHDQHTRDHGRVTV